MDPKDIKKLLEAVAEADVNEFTLETGDYKLTLRRGTAMVAPPQVSASAITPTAQAAALTPSPEPETPAQVESVKEETRKADNLVEVIAPIVGTFYASPSPDAPNYVKVGDKVNVGSVLCIIEAMKLMNEIEAEIAGTITEILVTNEEPVEYGQALFRIDPS